MNKSESLLDSEMQNISSDFERKIITKSLLEVLI